MNRKIVHKNCLLEETENKWKIDREWTNYNCKITSWTCSKLAPTFWTGSQRGPTRKSNLTSTASTTATVTSTSGCDRKTRSCSWSYSEIKHFDWMLKVVIQVLTNQSALFHSWELLLYSENVQWYIASWRQTHKRNSV